MSAAAFKSFALYIWTRHRPLIVGCVLAYVAIFALYDTLWALDGKPFAAPMLTFLRAAPFLLPLLLCTSAVSVATADLATGESWYPKHFFRLPLTSNQLALPFMAFSVGIYALLWAAAIGISGGRVLLTGPLEVPPELLRRHAWDPFLPLAELVWIQALIWKPFRRRWSRIAIMLGLIAAYFTALIFAIASGAPEAVMVAGSLAQVPLAYFVGLRGIAQARRGDTWHLRGAAVRRSRLWVRRIDQRPFVSGAAAQSWFETNVQRTRAGFVASFLVPLILLFSLIGSLMVGREAVQAAGLAQRVTVLMIATLGFVALASGPAFAAFDVGVQSFKNNAFRMPSFFAALPLSTGQFAWLKLRTAARRMAFIATIVLAAAVVVFEITGMNERWLAGLRAQHGTFEAAALLAFCAAAFLGLTAVGTANVVWIALIGRSWRLANAGIAIVVIAALLLPAWIIAEPSRLQTAADVGRTLLPIAAAAKLGGLALLIYVVGSRQLYSWPRVGCIAACWLAAVTACFAVYFRYVPESVASFGVFASSVILLLPVLGIFGAPLALHSNRCR